MFLSIYIYDYLQGAHEQCFVPLLSLIPWMYVPYNGLLKERYKGG